MSTKKGGGPPPSSSSKGTNANPEKKKSGIASTTGVPTPSTTKKGTMVPPPELSVKQSKAARKAEKQMLEADRLEARERMEKMMLDSDDEETNVFTIATNAAKALEKELGSNGGFRDAFGNTTSVDPSVSKEAARLLAKQRMEAKARREAKFKAEEEAAAAAALATTTCSSSKKKPVLSRQEEIAAILAKVTSNEPLSNKEKKLLKKHEEEQAEEMAMHQEFESGLANYSLSISGRGAMVASDDEQDEEDEGVTRKTLSATDVIVPCFTITAPHRVLFFDATLKLVSGRRYGLIGPNGRGKTTLLKFIASRRLPVPDGVDVFMLDQEFASSNEAVVDQVLAADERRTRLLSEESQLLMLLDKSCNSNSTEDNGEEEDVEEEDEDEQQLPRDASSSHSSSIDLAKTVERLQVLGTELDAIGAYSSEAKVRRILTGLGFTECMQNQSSMILSGGWRVRVSLARALFMEPRLLLLDEPTNHLDIDAVLFLDDHLATKWKGTILTVSHDCDFLDSICTNIMHIDDQKINYYAGNVTSFEKMKHQILAKKIKSYKLQQKTIKEFTSAPQGLTVEKARKRTMEKLGIGELMESEPKDYRVNFNFKFAEDDAPTISVLDVGFYYNTNSSDSSSSSGSRTVTSIPMTEKKILFSGLRFSIGTKSRICLVGANGSGKTTLLKLLTGRLEPTEGVVSFHRLLRLGIYDQHFDDLLPFNKTPIEYLTKEFENVSELEARKYLGMFGLDGARHLIKIGELSGGQKSRVVFASLALKCPHVLILDEPTNHLDLESVDALVRALQVFPGGVVVVSHDARLITSLECEIWVCQGGLIHEDGIEGTGIRVERRGFEYYRLDLLRQISAKAARAEKQAELKAAKRKVERDQKLNKAVELHNKRKGMKIAGNGSKEGGGS